MDDFLGIVGAILIAIFIVALFAGLGGIFVMLLWNWLMPVIFGLPQITFWQAIGVGLLSGILFRPASFSSSKKG